MAPDDGTPPPPESGEQLEWVTDAPMSPGLVSSKVEQLDSKRKTSSRTIPRYDMPSLPRPLPAPQPPGAFKGPTWAVDERRFLLPA